MTFDKYDVNKDGKIDEVIADIATVYVVAASGVVAAYFGFNAMEAKK